MAELCAFLQSSFSSSDEWEYDVNGTSTISVIPLSSSSASTTGYFTTNYNHTTPSNETFYENDSDGITQLMSQTVVVILSSYVSPLVSLIGLFGNVVSVFVLSRLQHRMPTQSKMTSSAHIGLTALAITDFLYCLSVVPKLFVGNTPLVHQRRSFALLYLMYGHCWQNVFLFSSTWITVSIAIGRYTAICYPLQARYLISRKVTSMSTILIFVTSLLIQLPLFWTWTEQEIKCDGDVTYIIVDHGQFVTSAMMKTVFTYVWFFTGFVVPISALTYCNAHLIRALRESSRVQRMYRANNSTAGTSSSHVPDMTATLIAVISFFIVLVTPSEVCHFLYYVIANDNWSSFSVLMATANTMQTVNFAANFVLYFALNRHFRHALRGMLCDGTSYGQLYYGRNGHRDSQHNYTAVRTSSPQQRMQLGATRSFSVACETAL